MMVLRIKKENVLITLFLLSMLLFSIFAGSSPKPLEDSGVYVSAARGIAQGKGFVGVNAPEGVYKIKPAPGYSYVLAFFISLKADNLFLFKILSLLFTLGTILLFNKILDEWVLPAWSKVFIISFIIFNPFYLYWSDAIVSEPLFGLGFMLTVYLWLKYEKSTNIYFAVGSIIVASLAFGVRYIGITSLLALCLISVLKKDKKLFAMSIICFFLCIAWILFSKTGYVSELTNKNYSSDPNVSREKINVISLAVRYCYNVTAYIGNYLSGIVCAPLRDLSPRSVLGTGKIFLGFSVAFVCFLGLLRSVKDNWKTCLIPGMYCLIIPIYTTYYPRFLLPVFPFIVMFYVQGMNSINKLQIRRLLYLISSLFLLVNLSFSFIQLNDLRNLYSPSWKAFYKAADFIESDLDADAIVYTRKPFLLYMLSGKKTLRYQHTYDIVAQKTHFEKYKGAYILYDEIMGKKYQLSTEFLKPVIDAYPELFTRVYEDDSRDVKVYKIKE